MRNLNLMDKAFLLKKTPFFESLDLDLLLSIADKMEAMHYRPTEQIFSIDQEAHRMYLIVSGEVAIAARDGKHLAALGAGEFFGEESLLSEKRRSYAACCLTKVHLLALTRSHLLSIIYECPSIALSLLNAYSSHLLFRPRTRA